MIKIVYSSKSPNIQRLINYVNTANELKNVSSWQWALNSLLLHYSEPISSNTTISPKEYLLAVPGFTKSEEQEKFCNDRTFSMCVETDRAFEKCQVLSDISTDYGIQPKLDCIITSNCGEKIKAGEVDVMILDADKIASFRRYKFQKLVTN